ncbi:HD domain-containing protein [Winogradskyella aurantiaca]|uniref:HD domain-containing protein n=1 Tax=Winogradskyella aurantiaca TaxID=2219558 RepID=UPI000E1DCD11|nr:HD domain-containing protein [Winogradskyella aurantiaca]
MLNNKLKIFNDPIYGFITIPNALIFDLIEHPFFQRLRRISQMGLSYLVYPGAHHTRFHHALGSMFLMQKAVQVLRSKQVVISEDEEQALYIAIMLHDIGHGPFSHAMEHSIVDGIPHEFLSLKFMESLNKQFNNQLELAISVFKGDHHRRFMGQLISSQIDMDRADYLKRDSFYTGVAEGNINSERLITMMNVIDDELVIEEKGVYSVEKFLIARRFMYWQVYLHKTGIVAEELLMRILKRAKELVENGQSVKGSESLQYFLSHSVGMGEMNEANLQKFAFLDDYDVLSALKEWMGHKDFVLSRLSHMLINRNLLRIKMKTKRFSKSKVEELRKNFAQRNELSNYEAGYFVFTNEISNRAYNPKAQPIKVLLKTGKIKPLNKVSNHLNIGDISNSITKYYLCYPKSLD